MTVNNGNTGTVKSVVDTSNKSFQPFQKFFTGDPPTQLGIKEASLKNVFLNLNVQSRP